MLTPLFSTTVAILLAICVVLFKELRESQRICRQYRDRFYEKSQDLSIEKSKYESLKALIMEFYEENP